MYNVHSYIAATGARSKGYETETREAADAIFGQYIQQAAGWHIEVVMLEDGVEVKRCNLAEITPL